MIKKGAGAFIQLSIGVLGLALLLASCRGSNNPNDVITGAPPAAPVPVAGPDGFLLYPNPQSAASIDSDAYATAYYEAIDPLNQRTTLSAWKSLNGFDNPSPGSYVKAVFGDKRDLGYGRYVHAVDSGNGNYAFYVDNYLVWSAAGYGYSDMNLDAAVAQNKRWFIGTNAIEFSEGVTGTHKFTKYYTFDTAGNRLNKANLDGRGDKYMPGICTSCHGGRGDPLTPAYGSPTGKQLFALIGDPEESVRGDLEGKFHFFEPETYSFSALPGFTRPDQEANIKTLNQWILCTYPLTYAQSGVPVTNPEDVCRSPAPLEEWQGAMAVDVLKQAYGGDGLPSPTYLDTYAPLEWKAAGQSDLYMNVVQPTCRMCHMLRGNGQDTDNDYANFAAFQNSADRIKAHIIDRGNMPLTKVLYNTFWSTPAMYNTLIKFLQDPDPLNHSLVGYTVTDSSGAPLMPGRPIAEPGLSRYVGSTSSISVASPYVTHLSAKGSLFADTYTWSFVSNPNSAGTLISPTSMETDLSVTADGTYIVELAVSKGGKQIDTKQLTILVNTGIAWPVNNYPSAVVAAISNPSSASSIKFYDIKKILQRNPVIGTRSCITCHTPHPTDGSSPPPIMFSDIDRHTNLHNGPADVAVDSSGLNASGVIAVDDYWFWTELRGRINFDDIPGSPLLRHPSGHLHFGGTLPGFGIPASGIPADELPPGDHNRSYYDVFLNWILNGAPYN
jgi:mono/diheme cytochrome c family protein